MCASLLQLTTPDMFCLRRARGGAYASESRYFGLILIFFSFLKQKNSFVPQNYQDSYFYTFTVRCLINQPTCRELLLLNQCKLSFASSND